MKYVPILKFFLKAFLFSTLFAIAAPSSLARTTAPEASILCEKAHQLFYKGQISKAIGLYSTAIKQTPNFLAAYLNAAVAYRALGKNKEASVLLEKALEIDRKNPRIQSELGWIYLHGDMPSEAREKFSRALDLKENDEISLLGLGISLLNQGKIEKSVKILEKLVKRRPDFAAAHFYLGRAYAENRAINRSTQSYTSALRRDWTFAEVRIYLAKAFQKLKNLKEAWKQYSRIKSLDPKDPQVKKSLKSLSETLPEEVTEPGPLPIIDFSPITDIEEEDRKRNVIRVGIWASSRGRPPKIGSITFAVSCPFKLEGTRTGKIYGEGKKGEKWIASHYRRNHSIVVTPDGKKLGPFRYGLRVKPLEKNHSTIIHELKNLDGKHRKYVKGREYRGSMVISTRRRGGIYLINEVPLEEYLLGVLPAEMPSTWPLEALKAQTVIARNQAVIRKKRLRPHRRYGYDICDSQHCQVYRGVTVETESTRRSIEETRGKLLYFKDNLALSYYHSTCGGHTQSAHKAWGWGRYNYLTGRLDGDPQEISPPRTPWDLALWIKGYPDANCKLNDLIPTAEFRWLRVVPAKTMERKLNRRRKSRVGKLRAIIPLERSSSGHANEILIRGSRRSVILRKEHKVRTTIGLESMRSSLLMIETVKDPSNHPKEFWIWGGGWGHGIGLCQTGAAGLARKKNAIFENILTFYYPGTEVR